MMQTFTITYADAIGTEHQMDVSAKSKQIAATIFTLNTNGTHILDVHTARPVVEVEWN